MADDCASKLSGILRRQKAAQLAGGVPPVALRIDRLNRAIALLVEHKNAIAEALRTDFGHRSVDTSLIADVAGSIGSLKHARAHVAQWMAPQQRRPTPSILAWLGAQARIDYMPKGVVGIIAPWNFPVQLVFAPLAGVFAAGCRAMVKPSEMAPKTAELIAEMVRSKFAEDELAVVTGGPDVAAEFTRLPFDHLMFTGGGKIAVAVAKAAAENLVPLTLELGGKSPVIIGRSADLKRTARRVIFGKTMNAGQICLAPDYALVPQERVAEFVWQSRAAVERMYPTLKDNPDYTSIINAQHHQRLNSYLTDALTKGAELVELNPAGESFASQPLHKVPPVLVVGATPDMAVMQEEIFGPILPVVTYGAIAEAIEFVNARPRPLGLYYFGEDEAEEALVLSRTMSGGVTVNDVVMHVSMEELPFGGIGPSGMGAYHGIEGFRTFSHARSVYRQSRRDVTGFLRPPFGRLFRWYVQNQIKR